ncbi:hypothetical protein POTOM_013895 [Populus tomentosa]|uniref:Major facilitator superfamily (MFS) profile domain-containing protein n=1 Tax=Populus tomentosa TaxID=118781 RepID=A0A8X8AH74_POPTO|nr:hypothetical protein POTOM_013895 [Populus tomentosa]
MASAFAPTSGGKEYPGKFTGRVLLTCIFAATGGLNLVMILVFQVCDGPYRGVTSMDVFLKKFFPDVYKRESSVKPSDDQYCKFDSQILTLFTSSLYLAALVSSIFASMATRKYGRRPTMMTSGLLFAAGAIVNGLAMNVPMLIIGRLLLGFGIGCANQWIEGEMAWRLSLGGAIVPGLIIFVGSCLLPDTPNSKIERGNYDRAQEQLLKLRKVDNVDEEFNDLVEAGEKAKLVQHACNASLFSSLITVIVNMLATFVSISTVDKFGRKKLFLYGGLQMLVSQIVITIAIAMKFGSSGNPGVISNGYAYTVVVFICVYVAAFAWSWGPLVWLVPSEIFPLEVRSAAQSITVSVNMIFTFVIAQIFTAMLCHLKFGLFICFAVCVIVMSIVIYKLLPETKGVPIEEMTTVWRDHPHWSKYFYEDDAKFETNKSKVIGFY